MPTKENQLITQDKITLKNELTIPVRKIRRNSYYHELQHEKTNQFYLSISIASWLAMLIYHCKQHQLSIYQFASYASAILVSHNFILFFHLLASSKQLHYVRIRRRRFDIGNVLFVPYGIEEDKSRPLTSVSAMIGLRGSNVEKSFSSLSHLIIGITLVAVTENLIQSDKYFFSNVVMLMTGYGLWLLLTWQIEYTVKSDLLHYLGAGMAFTGSFASLLIQQKCSEISLFITFWGLIPGIAFGAIRFTDLFQKLSVHYQSLLLISLEICLIISISIGNCVYLYNLA